MESTDINAAFLKNAGISSSISCLIPLKGGANNRVYKVVLADSTSIVLKHYFSHPLDTRPRLKSEFEFLLYAWESGIRSIPQPFTQDPIQNMALYSYIDGIPAINRHSNQSYVEAASDFLHRLNENRLLGKHLGRASESCVQISEYLFLVEKRIEKLLSLPTNTPSHQKLRAFLKACLIPKWIECKSALHSLDLSKEDLIISPSDFGLHNTIISAGKPYFIDFEYAGWDDPAKTICDFFLQPKISIPMDSFDSFSQAVAGLTDNPTKTLERARYLFPISKIKWCCIILNVFLNTGKSRRDFADHPHIFETQLQLADRYLTNGPSI